MSLEVLIAILVFVYGACIGSFLNVLIWRLPRGESVLGRSHCPHCGHTLGLMDLFPFFSYLALAGHCRYCRGKVSARYFIIELVTALLFVFAYSQILPQAAGEWMLLIKILFALAVLVAVFVIDLEHYLILDIVVWPAVVTILILNFITAMLGGNFSAAWLVSNFLAVLGGCGLFFLLWFFSKGRWMGFGDVKLGVFLGLFLGWPLILVGLFVSVLLGGAAGVVLMGFFKRGFKSQVPFGTFLAVGSVITAFWGQAILRAYLSYMGF